MTPHGGIRASRSPSIELVYANNAVCHMISGKAVARAIRGHLLVDAAFNTYGPSPEAIP